MSTSKEFIEYVCDQIQEWTPIYKKMFGEYMVYVQSKPIFLVCDDTVYIKQLECLLPLMENAEKGCPYNGAKEHYIVDIDDRNLVSSLVPLLIDHTPVPKKKNTKKSTVTD